MNKERCPKCNGTIKAWMERSPDGKSKCANCGFEGLHTAWIKENSEAELERLRVIANTCKHDYWFMINLIERYGTDKEQTLKDCLERMKFRQPMFKEIGVDG